MKSALITLLTLLGLVVLVEFLGRPVRGEPLQKGIVHQPDATIPDGLGRVRGQVVTKAGQPVAGLRVASTRPDPVRRFRHLRWNGPSAIQHETRTDESGRFELDADPAEPVRVWAGSDRWLWGMTHPVEVRAGHVSRGVLVTVEPRPARPR